MSRQCERSSCLRLNARKLSPRRERCCPPNISSVTTDHDDSCELPSIGGGAYSFCRSQMIWTTSPRRYSRIQGITAPPLVPVRDGRTPRNRSDRASKSTDESPADEPRRHAPCQIVSTENLIGLPVVEITEPRRVIVTPQGSKVETRGRAFIHAGRWTEAEDV